ncbi:MAG: hypothetical protein V4671_18045 [Armatimonadota bacterium]
MPLTRRENPLPASRQPHSPSLEDVLRDAACFANDEAAPNGLAYRALAQEIAAQNRRGLPQVEQHPVKKRRAALWLGGLSAGTLAGASAALIIVTHLNGSLLSLAPEAAIINESAPTESAPTVSRVVGLPPVAEATPVSRPQKTTVASASMTAIKRPIVVPRQSSHRLQPITFAEPKEIRTAARTSRPRSRAALRLSHSTPVARHTATPARESVATPVARWKTEPFEDTEYQLVTTAYAPSPGSGNYPSRPDHFQLTPVRMRGSSEPTTMEPMAGSALPLY